MFRSQFLATIPFTAALLAACGSPASTPAADTDPVVELGSSGDILVAALARDAVESAQFVSAPVPPADGQPAKTAPDPAVIRAQILLDRARYSPGVIDGLGGDNTQRALAAFEKANKLKSDGILDAEVFQKLATANPAKVLADYTITAEDVAGPFIGNAAMDMEAMSKLERVGYRTAIEGLAEKFHMTEDLLRALNPRADFTKVGQALLVAAVTADDLTTDVAEIIVDRAERSVRVMDAEGKLLAFYPATIGSTARPAPTGALEVVTVAPNPNYTYDPSRVTFGEGEQKLIIQPGPNNPVGSIWIGLSRDTYGIHGTPDPSKVGKTFSSGCIRLTNWDAQQLASRVRTGAKVVIR